MAGLADVMSILGNFARVVGTAQQALDSHTKKMEKAAAAADKLAEKIAKADRGGKPLTALPASSGGGGGLGALAGSLGAVAGAATAAVGAMMGLYKTVTSFVEAINPQLVAVLNTALENITATIGQAFEPALQVFLNAIRQVPEIIGPIFEDLAPIIKQFADLFVSNFLTQVQVAADVFRALSPLLDILMVTIKISTATFKLVMGLLVLALSPVLVLLQLVAFALKPFEFLLDLVTAAMDGLGQILATVGRIFQAVFLGIVDMVKAFLGGLLGTVDVFGSLKNAVNSVIRTMVTLAALLAKSLGLDSVFKRLRDAFAPNRGAKVAAPKEFGFASIEEIMRQNLLGAAQAGAGGGKSEKDILADIFDRIDKGSLTLGSFLGNLPDTVKSKFYDALIDFHKYITRPGGTVGTVTGGVGAFFNPGSIISTLLGIP